VTEGGLSDPKSRFFRLFPYQVTVTELTGWEHSLKNELILARRVHREHKGARQELEQLLATTGVRPKLIRDA
jgi:hypothetical protein